MYAASLTKPVSAYLFLRMVDKGIFSLDKPLYQYLKNPIGTYAKWKDLADDTTAFKKITARMLLSHSAGLPILRFMYNNKVSLIARPGEKFYYSNEGMNLLGFVIEEYTGKHLEVLARQEVFGPLGMANTSMIWEPAFEQNYAVAYFKNGKEYGAEKRESARAAGSMTSNAADYAKLVTHLLKKQGLSAGLYGQMLSPQIAVTSRKGFGPERDTLTHIYDKIGLSWGVGVGLFRSPYGKAFFHTGHGDANQNYFVAYPEKGIAVVLFSNSENFEHAAGGILSTCIGDVYSPLRWLGYPDN